MDDLTNKAFMLGKLLLEHNGKEVVVVDLRSLSSWTDFFVIATATSATHLSGLLRRVKEWAAEAQMPLRCGSYAAKDDMWNLADLGTIVVHLMTESAREFYELENLWCDGKITKLTEH